MNEFIISGIGILISYFFGTLWIERKHLANIRAREENFITFPSLSLKSIGAKQTSGIWLTSGSCVVSIDPFKKFFFQLTNIFGGQVLSYESLIDRARREALLRMKEKAKKVNANAIIGVRLETSTISKNHFLLGSVEIHAYGTALKIIQ